MAIQKINLGTEPLGEGGDTYRSANTKINENFSNTTHAASRLVGKDVGNLVEMTAGGVGGFGLGGVKNINPDVNLQDQHIVGLGAAQISSGNVPEDAPDRQIGKILYLGNPAWGSQMWFSYNASKVYFRNKPTTGDYESWKEFYHSGTSNLAANSIQIGVGAPKIAYKKLTGAFKETVGAYTSISHGLNAAKILDVVVTAKSSLGTDYHKSSSAIANVRFDFYFDAVSIHVRPSSDATRLANQTFTILITYEV